MFQNLNRHETIYKKINFGSNQDIFSQFNQSIENSHINEDKVLINDIYVSGKNNIHKIQKIKEKDLDDAPDKIAKLLHDIPVEDKEYPNNRIFKKFNKEKSIKNNIMFFVISSIGMPLLFKLCKQNTQNLKSTSLKLIMGFTLPLSIIKYYTEKGSPEAEYQTRKLSIPSKVRVKYPLRIGEAALIEGFKEFIKDVKKLVLVKSSNKGAE